MKFLLKFFRLLDNIITHYLKLAVKIKNTTVGTVIKC